MTHRTDPTHQIHRRKRPIQSVDRLYAIDASQPSYVVCMPVPDLDLVLINPDSEMCAAWSTEFDRFGGIEIICDVFEDLEQHDCFVTAANSFGMMTAGIDAAVVDFHGDHRSRQIANGSV